MKIRYSEFVNNIDIDAFEELIGFEPLYQRGDEDVGYCPDMWGLHKHGDTTGKFAINREKRVYHCFVCGGGSLLFLLAEIKNIDIDEATTVIYKLTSGDNRSDDKFLDYYRDLISDIERRTETLPYFNEHVLNRFDAPTDWFQTRGISPEIIERYNLRMGKDITKIAPVCNGEKIDDDYVGNCAIFPHYWKDKLVGWQHRWLDDDRPRWVAKYTNTTDFPKNDTLFNYDNSLKSNTAILLVESVPSALFAESMGYSSVATFGSNMSDTQLRLLRRFQNGIILWPDNDSAGRKWQEQIFNYLKDYIPMYILPVIDGEEGSDLGDLAKVDNPREIITYLLEQAKLPNYLS